MNEAHSKRRLLVSFDGDSAPHVIVPHAQTEKLRKLFTKHAVPHTINTRGQEEFAIFDLGRDADIRLVQAVLDSVA